MLQQHHDLLSHTLKYPSNLPQQEQFELAGGVEVSLTDVGILRFEPPQPDAADIVLSAGVHGNETGPIELLNRLVQELLAGTLNCRNRLLILLGNPPAMVVGKRELEHNMNRLFSGNHSNYQGDEAQRAKRLELAVTEFFQQRDGQRYHYDLHTAIRDSKREKFAIYPFRHGKPWKRQQLAFLANGGIDTALLIHSPQTTFSYFSSNQFGADAFTVELGKVRPFGHNDSQSVAQIESQLRRLISAEPVLIDAAAPLTVFDVAQEINKQSDAFTLNFADDAANFTEYQRGDLLAQDGEVEYRAKADGEAIVFPNAKVALGQRALLTVLPVGAEQPFE
ncbi:succinylglutamate desuccinylase [Ferrimonas lipolytica]|uniref:Succinylglutamate desuccinylase n=1 Tax=Ferrimonas lipolytica TaxID=2724191 RepID=A0A6H1UEE3_9GAMM|nr:succinylglutamate desuccinylase [Ferrimonas lipolytica]QIZ76162.1 succinylglutamate desuccinylase [Ferrimonas lipolytica]